MSQSLFSGNPFNLPVSASSGSQPPQQRRRFSVTYRFLGVSSLLNLNRVLICTTSPLPDPAGHKKDDQMIDKIVPSSNFPTWAQWVKGSIIVSVALPYYQNFSKVEDKVEKTAEQVLDTVENIAQVIEKLSVAVAEKTEDKKLKQMILKVEEVAEVVDKTAEAAESLIKKADEMVEEVDEVVKKLEEMSITGFLANADQIRSESQTDHQQTKEKVKTRK